MRLIALILVSLVVGTGLAHAQDSCVVQGRILGHDGKPLPKVRVRPLEPGARSTFADRAGRFELKLPCGSARVLDVAGVHHEDLLLPVILAPGPALDVEVRLRAQEWAGRYDSVRVIGEFNGFATESALPMTRRRDGTLAATVPCEAESLRYQLLGVAKDGLPTAGTLADAFFFRKGRSMASIRAGRKPVEVVFDPRRLPRPRRDKDAVVRFGDPRAMTAVVYPLFREDSEEEDRQGRAYQAHVAAGGDRDSFRWDGSGYVSGLKRRIATERDPLRRQYLLLTYTRHATADSDSVIARRALDEIPPDSPLWALAPGGPSGPLWNIRRAIGRSSVTRVYAEKGSEGHPDREVRAGFLMAAMSEAETAGDKDRLGRYVTRMLDEFAGTQVADMAARASRPTGPSGWASRRPSSRSRVSRTPPR